MAGAYIEWSIEGETHLSRRLEGLASKLEDHREPLSKSAEYLRLTFARDVFASQGGVIEEKWVPLSPVTVARKARENMPTTPLIATGNMRASFRSIVSSDQAVVYNTAEYFKYHQSNKPRRKIPRRVMMKLAENQKQQVVKYFQAFLREANTPSS